MHPQLVSAPAFSEELALLSAPAEATLTAVLQRPDLRLVILRAGCSYRQRLEELLARRGVVGLRRLEFGTLEAILGAVAAGLGITLMPHALIGAAWRGGKVRAHRLRPAEARVQTVFVRRRDRLRQRSPPRLREARDKGATEMMRGSTTIFTVEDAATSLAYYRDCIGSRSPRVRHANLLCRPVLG